MSNVVYEWNSICTSSARKVAEESVSRDCMTGFAEDLIEHEEENEDEWEEVEPLLRELTDIPYYLYKECREEGMTKEEAIEETQNRFWEK
tara:strand:- start:235 stop:504 length:270 start_codon:yes stop_codon:yes gene_type:complete